MEFVSNLALILLVALLGALVLYGLMPLAFSDPTLRKDIKKLRAYIWERVTRPWKTFAEVGGYVHDVVQIVVPFTKFAHTAGTWTATVASNIWYNRRTAADAAATTYIPLMDVTQRDGALKGAKLTSVDFHFRISAAGIDAMEAHLYKGTLAADGTLWTTAEVTTSYDTGHDSAAERIDADEHKMTLTVTTPFYLEDNEVLYMEVVWDGSAAGVIDEFFAVGNWTIRL